MLGQLREVQQLGWLNKTDVIAEELFGDDAYDDAEDKNRLHPQVQSLVSWMLVGFRDQARNALKGLPAKVNKAMTKVNKAMWGTPHRFRPRRSVLIVFRLDYRQDLGCCGEARQRDRRRRDVYQGLRWQEVRGRAATRFGAPRRAQ
jgi:hypothetical protein